MFLAHFSGWSYGDLMNMTTEEIYNWHLEALKLHNHLNSSPEEDGG